MNTTPNTDNPQVPECEHRASAPTSAAAARRMNALSSAATRRTDAPSDEATRPTKSTIASDTPIHLIDYLELQLASFEGVPFNPVDAAALSQLCMVRGEGAIPPLPGREGHLENSHQNEERCRVGEETRSGEAGELGKEQTSETGDGSEKGRRRSLVAKRLFGNDSKGEACGENGSACKIDSKNGLASSAENGQGKTHCSEPGTHRRFARLRRLFGVGPKRAPEQAQMPAADAHPPAPPTVPTVPLRDLLRAESFPTMFTGLNPEKIKRNLFALAASPRFREVEVGLYLSKFDEALETQFAAMTFVYRDLFAFVGFRGTDESITGWKEDFNMAYAEPVPAQDQALRYLNEVATLVPQPLIIGGHSKGGNLAEYASLRAPAVVQDRIVCVYNLDGPGFKNNMAAHEGRIVESSAIADTSTVNLDDAARSPAPGALPSDTPAAVSDAATSGADAALPLASDNASSTAPAVASAARSLLDRMCKIVPQESIVGILLNSPTEPRVVHSDARGINQHSVFSWEVDSSLRDFAYLDELPHATRIMAATLQDWLARYDDAQRIQLVSALFAAIEASGAENARDILADKSRAFGFLMEAARNASDADRAVLAEAGRDFIGSAAGSAAIHAAGEIGKQIGRGVANLMSSRDTEDR